MKTLASIRAELEEDRTWRQDEIRMLRNLLASMSNEDEQKRFRRSLVLMLYAHYEGFCKVALLQYVKSINLAAIPCRDAAPAVVAATWDRIFHRLENPTRKCDIFRADLPDDTQLHRFARRRDFVGEIGTFDKVVAKVPDETVDAESNLTPLVLRKNLYRIGLDHDALDSWEGDINHLLNRRNKIAHGQERDGLTALEYERVEKAAFRVMEGVMDLVMQAIQQQVFRKQGPSSTPMSLPSTPP